MYQVYSVSLVIFMSISGEVRTSKQTWRSVK